MMAHDGHIDGAKGSQESLKAAFSAAMIVATNVLAQLTHERQHISNSVSVVEKP